jgi:uncharacterized protein (TIGR02452 family)
MNTDRYNPVPVPQLVKVWQETYERYKDVEEKESTVFRASQAPTQDAIAALERKYERELNAPVWNMDCVYLAIKYKEGGFNPILLNMCDWDVAGGAVRRGSRAQEEDLFRRSDYYKHLHQKYYPLNDFDTIISHGVEFYREGSDKGYVLMKEPVKIDCIAAPALINPRLKSDGDDFELEEDRKFMEDKVRMLLYCAAKNGNDAIILSAWGCGAYGCPVKGMCNVFSKVLKEYVGVLECSSFGIIGNNWRKWI